MLNVSDNVAAVKKTTQYLEILRILPRAPRAYGRVQLLGVYTCVSSRAWPQSGNPEQLQNNVAANMCNMDRCMCCRIPSPCWGRWQRRCRRPLNYGKPCNRIPLRRKHDVIEPYMGFWDGSLPSCSMLVTLLDLLATCQYSCAGEWTHRVVTGASWRKWAIH